MLEPVRQKVFPECFRERPLSGCKRGMCVGIPAADNRPAHCEAATASRVIQPWWLKRFVYQPTVLCRLPSLPARPAAAAAGGDVSPWRSPARFSAPPQELACARLPADGSNCLPPPRPFAPEPIRRGEETTLGKREARRRRIAACPGSHAKASAKERIGSAQKEKNSALGIYCTPATKTFGECLKRRRQRQKKHKGASFFPLARFSFDSFKPEGRNNASFISFGSEEEVGVFVSSRANCARGVKEVRFKGCRAVLPLRPHWSAGRACRSVTSPA